MYCDLHRHDEDSLFDGFGKPMELASIALEKGYTALGISNHGSTGSLVEHYYSCKEVGIKPILGVEAYFQPVFKAEKDSKRFHICLFAKSLKGYININKIMSEASRENFYYKPNVTFKTLSKYSEDVICTSGCVAGPISYAIQNRDKALANKYMQKFIDIFGDDFYLEIQPYKLMGSEGLQEKVNLALIKLGEKYNVNCILTSDSHYGRKEDFDTYLKMHEISGTKYDVGSTYYERYMPEVNELEKRFVAMHPEISNSKQVALKMKHNMAMLVDSVEDEILEGLKLNIPKVVGLEGVDSKEVLKKEIVKGLKKRGKYNKEYLDRCKEEYEVIVHHGFEDYFLIVQDYVKYAKDLGIYVGPGRGSVCNCEIAYALGITEVDSLYFGLDYTRFLRKDKKKLPDIDLDFDERRHEVIDYLISKYPTQSVQICSYGLYKIDNLINDLCKHCEVPEEEKKAIKTYIKKFESKEGILDVEALLEDKYTRVLNKRHDNIIKHFSLMYKKKRYYGTHAAGVAIVGDDILNYTAIRKAGDNYNSAYDLNDLERIMAIKFDILGLKTLTVIRELEEQTGESFDYSWFEDEDVYKMFRDGNTAGIFQFEKKAARNILNLIQADCFVDLVAANALNRPGPLSLKMPEIYADNKMNIDHIDKDSPYFNYTKKTYGTIVFQEQITAICRGLGKMSWSDSDRVLKFMKGSQMTERAIQAMHEEDAYLRGEFIKGAMENGLSKEEANDVFDKITVYSFNEGHAVGYTIISFILMWFKKHYPVQFYYLSMKYASDDASLSIYKAEAASLGNVILLPHVNGTSKFSTRKIQGEIALQEGLLNIKNVGEKAAQAIEDERNKNGKFKSYADFINRVPKNVCNARVINALENAGALEFNKDVYFKRVIKYNSTLYMKGGQN